MDWYEDDDNDFISNHIKELDDPYIRRAGIAKLYAEMAFHASKKLKKLGSKIIKGKVRLIRKRLSP